MGCDIHCFVEYKRKNGDNWSSLGGRINPGRNYDLFGKLAGVRNYDYKSPVAKDRGFPTDAGFYAIDKYTYFITDTEGENYVPKERAERWVSQGSSAYIGEDKRRITGPDWHSPSWCTSNELESCLNDYSYEYKAVLASMKSLESDGFEVRMIFFFDN